MFNRNTLGLDNFLTRSRGKLLRDMRPYLDSFSLYYSLPPLSRKVERLADYAIVGANSSIIEQIVAPSPEYIEIGDNVLLSQLKTRKDSYVFVEHEVQDLDGLSCNQHCIKTPLNQYEGKNIAGNLVTLSVDFEAGVALSHVSAEDWDRYRPLWSSKEGAQRLAELFTRFDIPVTWAICGHLFLEECQGDHGFHEQEWYGDWFSHDPASDWEADTAWYLPDMVREIKDNPLFEIGYHTFGHFRYDFCSKETVLRDMEQAATLRKAWGIKLDSFVFPFNECGHFDLLTQNGSFKYLRGNIGRKYPSTGIIDFGSFCFFNTSQMFEPRTMQTCLNQTGSLGATPFNFYTHCHQWCSSDALAELETWLGSLARLRDAGVINIIRMGDVEQYRGGQPGAEAGPGARKP
jgi:peptidoglycan/xylan/chitin deacetylase (PgdA/CDA1 family)